MKKILMAMFLVYSGLANATDMKIYFGTLDTSDTNKPSIVGKDTVHRLQKEKICWLITDAPKNTNLNIVEKIQSPEGAIFTNPDARVVKNSNGTEHILTLSVKTNESGQFLQCWVFNANDPIGAYQETIQVEGQNPGEFRYKIEN